MAYYQDEGALIEFVSWQQVIRETSIPRSTLYEWIAEGLFPAPVKIGPRRVVFDRREVEAWKRGHLVERSNEAC